VLSPLTLTLAVEQCLVEREARHRYQHVVALVGQHTETHFERVTAARGDDHVLARVLHCTVSVLRRELLRHSGSGLGIAARVGVSVVFAAL